jgi:hypothetical protein
MPRLTKNQRVWICLEYARVNNACEVLRRWAERWGNLPAPTKRTVMKTYRKFVHEGTCLKVIPQFCIAHFYCAHLITYNFIPVYLPFKKISFYHNFMLLQNIFGYIRAKNYVKINVFKKGIQKSS